MDTSNFFIYPSENASEQVEAIVFLEHATDDDWQILLDFTSTRRFKSGDMVIEQGEDDDSLAFVASGELEVLIPKGRSGKLERLTTFSAGSVIGEQSFLDRNPRSTSIRAISDGELYRLSRDAFTVLSAKHPNLAMQVALDLGRILSIRLRNTTQFLSASKR
ncbi:cyclic nucleotide-binding domain-containing protein [Aliikangiella coralliicola]|uniref:Cyclic nucleotide-binding domain-containing protein n=1 Tax=Aliikangiella coralliicola TaxID=2592383 RepID=A0A545U6A7_9GAMM|nr:cyclic nucleotide-binding domain-containing protein [Aliikangiella coralliicola]TQV85011.1 cyclic nucleotide-binding domain-containing protein [Aliikangiella coralliicola]